MDTAAKARVGNIGLGIWLMASAFLWRDPPQSLNTLFTGALVAVVAGLSWWRVPWLRAANIGLGAWLFWSTLLMPWTIGATVLNQIVVSMAITVLAFVPFWSVPLDQDEPSSVGALHAV
jgi:hypothetical protein